MSKSSSKLARAMLQLERRWSSDPQRRHCPALTRSNNFRRSVPGFHRSYSSVSRVPAELVGRETFRSNFFKASPLRGFAEIDDDEFEDDPLFGGERADLPFRPDFLSVALSVNKLFSDACVTFEDDFLEGVLFEVEIPPSFSCSR